MADSPQATTADVTTEKHPVDQVLPFPQMFVYGLQHVMSMYAGVVAVPLIVGNAYKLPQGDITFLISAGLLMSGLATILQTIGFWKLGARQPIVQGTSFAAVSTILAVGAASGGGTTALREVYGAIIVAGIVAFLIAPFFTMLLRFFPEVVTGTVITVIGISLLPVAMRWAGGGNPAAESFASPPEHRARLRHGVDHRVDLPIPAGRLRPGRDPAGPRHRHDRRHPVRDDQFQPDR